MDLSIITQTAYYAGLFKSSPKVTLHLSAGNSLELGTDSTSGSEHQFEIWECEVCSYRNPPGLSPAAARVCALCGVPRSSIPQPVKVVNPTTSPLERYLDHDDLTARMIKLSFRKGGDRAFYTVLKRSLMARAWEAR